MTPDKTAQLVAEPQAVVFEVEFSPELETESLFRIMRSIQDKITALDFPSWDQDDMREHSLVQLMYALAVRIPEMEPSTLAMLTDTYAYNDRWRMMLQDDGIHQQTFLLLHEAVITHPHYQQAYAVAGEPEA